MGNLRRAIEIAVAAHDGQIEKSDAPYILHPLRVMLCMRTEDERIVAVLHDVVEDSRDWSLERLRAEGFPDHIVRAVDAVTKRKGEAYGDFVLRAGLDPIGRSVKLADLEDNCDLGRIKEPTEKDHARIEKYRCAIETLRKQDAAPAPEGAR